MRTGHQVAAIPVTLADPCAVCGSERIAHSCTVTLANPCTFALTESGGVTYATAYSCAFTRAIRDA